MTAAGYVALSIAGGLGMYFALGGLFELLYYKRRRRDPASWKTQPQRWANRKARRAELLLGTVNLIAAGVASGLFAHHVASGGASSIYFDLSEHGVAFSIATALLYLIGTDGALYWAHRLMHRRWAFRHIHRVHHRWTSPTSFTAHAMHPAEFALYQGIMLVPLLFWPIHVVGLVIVLVYQNLIAMIDHSGIDFGSALPWQPPARFHDDHHVHFHVNYGQTLGCWDRWFGTWRRVGRRYGEHVFGGQGEAVGAESGGPRLIDYFAKAGSERDRHQVPSSLAATAASRPGDADVADHGRNLEAP